MMGESFANWIQQARINSFFTMPSQRSATPATLTTFSASPFTDQ